MEWKLIETAPLDGTWVLLTGGRIEYGWCEKDKPTIVVAQRSGECWQFAWYDGGYYGEYELPTHWMPLPEAPNAQVQAAPGSLGVAPGTES